MFTGAVGLGGPPLAVCASMAGWDKNVARAIFGAFFMFSISIAVIFDILYGLVTPVVMQHTLVGLPGVLLGTLVGLPAARKIRQETFRRSMMWIVLLGAISLLFKAFLHELQPFHSYRYPDIHIEVYFFVLTSLSKLEDIERLPPFLRLKFGRCDVLCMVFTNIFWIN